MAHIDLNKIINNNLCIGCGLCSLDANTKGMFFNKRNDCYTPKIHNKKCIEGLQICPGKGYDIVKMADQLFRDGSTKYDIELGFYHSYSAIHSKDEKILENASSGGIITSILLYLIRNNIVDKVSITQFTCNEEGVRTRSFLTKEEKEIIKGQGSKYCPVNFESLLQELHTYNGKVAIVATPCVIAGIRNIQNLYPNYIKSQIIFTISNFCGGFKSYRNISRLAQIHNINVHNLEYFRFRGGGQPGSLQFIEKTGKKAETQYPLYVGLNGYSKMYRCHVCPDATGELADISCGDAWIPRFERDSKPWSMVICRSKNSTDLIAKMLRNDKIEQQTVSIEEIKLSQRYNLASKKKRQKARMQLYNKVGYITPNFDGGYFNNVTSMKTELTVFIKHKLTLLAEKLGLYMALYGTKKLKRNKKS